MLGRLWWSDLDIAKSGLIGSVNQHLVWRPVAGVHFGGVDDDVMQQSKLAGSNDSYHGSNSDPNEDQL